MAETIPEPHWDSYKSVVHRIKMKWIAKYGPKAAEYFGV